jgi:ABC-type transport system substrate-binding protein
LENRLASARAAWLQQVQKSGESADALRLAEQWAPAIRSEDELGKAILSLWIEQAKGALANSDHAAARRWLTSIDRHFADTPAAEDLRKAMHEQARSKLAPGKTLVVAVRTLPENLSPATAWTEIERQSLGLLFERLYQVDQETALGAHYVPRLALALPPRDLDLSIALRRDAYFASGERVTAADVRNTASLMVNPDASGRPALWREFFDGLPVAEDPLHAKIRYQQGLFDPLAPLTFWILPRFYKGAELKHADNADFAKAPIGSGPFQFQGKKQEDDRAVALFEANPHDLRRGAITAIRMVKWTDPGKDLGKPLPHLILDAPTDQLPALQALGYSERGTKSPGRITFLAVNHRRPALGSVNVRRAIAHAIDREGLLNRHFRSEAVKAKHHTAANSLFPRDSWANAPAPRVPADLFNAEQARSSARAAKEDTSEIALTLKYPLGDARVKASCEEMASAIGAIFRDAGIKANVQAQGLPPAALRHALAQREYDLLYLSEDGFDDPVRLALLFDRDESATRAGGSNYLGYDSDAKLHELTRAALQHRQFREVEDNMQAIHVHLTKTMPAIPLWHLDVHVLALPSLQTQPLNPRGVFDRIREWKLN